ncbi:PD-(D/E)XK nuclease family protein, partial [Microbaculum marinum]
RLLEALPDLPPDERRAAGELALGWQAPDWPTAQRQHVLDTVLAVLDDPAFAAAFVPGAQAEVSIAGRAGPGAPPLVGQIDRLAVTDDEVLIVDYKSDRVVPESAEAVPHGYLAQLAAYRDLARRIWPDRTVRAALLWTSGPTLMALPDGLMDAHAGPDRDA